MEKNYISKCEQTHFYISLVNKTYGVRINIKDIGNAEEIIRFYKKNNKRKIEAWKQEWKVGVSECI